MAEDAVRIEEFAELGAMPDAALALFGADAFSTSGWYASVAAAAMAPGARPCFHVAYRGEAVLGVVPMRRGADGLSALTTPYTVLWSPLLAGGVPPADIVAVGRALGRRWRGWPCTRLDALDPDAAWLPPLLGGLRRAGLLPLRFDHFGNWRLGVAGLGWDAYLAGRPGELRTAIGRRTRRLLQGEGARFTLVDGPDGLEAALAAYDRVYAASWKEAEPYSRFNPTLMRAAALSGGLRLGVLHLGDVPIAVQFWLLHDGGAGCWAGVQKLAHDEAHRRWAPGTVLTALMVRHLLEQDGAAALDFGRGDDPYKRSWTGERRQRVGVVLAAPWRAAGAVQIARHWAGRWRRRTGLTP